MKPLDIIEQNLTKEEFIAYLRGSILMFLLSERPLVLSEFKLYANKLVEVVKSPLVGSAIEETPQEQPQMQPIIDPDEPQVIKPFKFKIGDHVLISKGTDNERTGVIIRLPMDGVDCRTSYIVDLDDKDLGWTATVAVDGVDCENAWVTSENNMELLEKTLEANKWYHTKDFTLEELSKLLPKGTIIEAEKQVLYAGIETEPPTETTTGVVESIVTSLLTKEPLIEINASGFLKEWFKLVEKSK